MKYVSTKNSCLRSCPIIEKAANEELHLSQVKSSLTDNNCIINNMWFKRTLSLKSTSLSFMIYNNGASNVNYIFYTTNQRFMLATDGFKVQHLWRFSIDSNFSRRNKCKSDTSSAPVISPAEQRITKAHCFSCSQNIDNSISKSVQGSLIKAAQLQSTSHVMCLFLHFWDASEESFEHQPFIMSCVLT